MAYLEPVSQSNISHDAEPAAAMSITRPMAYANLMRSSSGIASSHMANSPSRPRCHRGIVRKTSGVTEVVSYIRSHMSLGGWREPSVPPVMWYR